jgi:HAMP domain-containing protein
MDGLTIAIILLLLLFIALWLFIPFIVIRILTKIFNKMERGE